MVAGVIERSNTIDVDFFMHEISAHIITGEKQYPNSLTWDLGEEGVRGAKFCLNFSDYFSF